MPAYVIFDVDIKDPARYQEFMAGVKPALEQAGAQYLARGGAHIASLLLTFFYREMKGLIANGHLFLAMPPLFRLSQGSKIVYARDDRDKEQIIRRDFKNGKVEVSRFKGLGEMMPAQLKETTMAPGKRTLLRVELAESEAKRTEALVERLMGKKPELRFQFIQENAQFAKDVDV